MSKKQGPLKPLIVALDQETDLEALSLVKHLATHVDLFKVGPVPFLKYGSAFVQAIRASGAHVFLDMKFHDIPSVVKKAIERAGEWGVYSATIHTSGGEEMMRQAASVQLRPKLWGVTVLTSFDQNDLAGIGISRSVDDQVVHLAKSAKAAGLDGVISSVREAVLIKSVCGSGFEVVTPGIRLCAGGDDQKRTQTPADAIQARANFFVMGRPILEAKDPVRAVKDVYESIGIPV